MNVLNLCDLSEDLTKKLNSIAEEERYLYTELVDKLSEKYKKNDSWWITPLVSRETSICEGFRDYCIARLAVNEISSGKYDRVIVSKKAIADTIKLNSGSVRLDIKLTEKKGERIKRLLPFLYNIWNIFKLYKRVSTVKKNCRLSDLKKVKNEKIILVDTYMIPSQFNNGKYTDRYFNGLKKNTNQNIVFLAQLDFNSLSEAAALANDVGKLDFVIAFEPYVQNNDFIDIIRYSKYCRNFRFNTCIIKDLDISPIVNFSLKQGASNITSMYGILKGNVVCRLISKYKMEIETLIGWYEGQPSSNGLFYKVRKFHENVLTIAYVYSPCPENNLGLYPSKMQRKNKGVAEIYASPGMAWLPSIRQFDKETECILAPSFRYHTDFQKEKESNIANADNVLLVLSGVIEVASQQLHSFFAAVKDFPFLQVIIKSHPFNENLTLLDYGINENEYENLKYKFIKGNMKDIVRNAKIAVLSETSSCLELIAKNIAVIVFVPSGRLSYHCMPKAYENLICEAYSAKEIRNYIVELENKKISRINMDKLLSEAFIAVNRDTVEEFIRGSRKL